MLNTIYHGRLEVSFWSLGVNVKYLAHAITPPSAELLVVEMGLRMIELRMEVSTSSSTPPFRVEVSIFLLRELHLNIVPYEGL